MLPTHNPPQPPQAGQPPAPPRPNVVWTLMAPPHVALQMWVDGSVKINFPPHLVNEVIQCFENHLTAFKGMKSMLDNPPKKCTGCRGSGQIMVKKGDVKEASVCPKCKGSGMMNLIPPNVPQTPPQQEPSAVPMLPQVLHAPMKPAGSLQTSAAPIRPLIQDDVPPALMLPHQQLTPLDLDGELMPKMQELLRKHGYKVTPLTKDEVAEDLARFTSERTGSVGYEPGQRLPDPALGITESKTEPPSGPIEEEEDESPGSSPTLSLAELAALGDQS